MPDASFPKTARLLLPAQYRAVFADHCRVRVAELTAWVCKTPGTQPRLGLVIAKKQFKRAVVRNRIKRQVRESFRLHRTELPPVDIIIGAYRGFDTLDSALIQARLQSLWTKIGDRLS